MQQELKTHMVIYSPKQNPSFTGCLFSGTETQCQDYCKNNNGKLGNFNTNIVVPINK